MMKILSATRRATWFVIGLSLGFGGISVAHAGPKIEHWTTAEGARVYFVATDALPILDVQIDIPSGSGQDPADKSGVASLTQGLLDAGAGTLDEEAIAAKQVDLAIRLGGSTDADRMSFTLRTLSDPAQRNDALALLRLLLSSPTFPDAVLTREKARTIAAIEEAATRPDAIAARQFSQALYPQHPYGRMATVESVKAITRDDLLAFHRQHFTAKGAVISLIGAVSRSEAEAVAASLSAALPSRAEALALPPVETRAGVTVRVAHPSTQAHIQVGMPSVQRSDPEYYALLVGNYSLGGGGFVSRLMKEVREKRGYAYSVYSYFLPRKLEGPFIIGLQTRREQADVALKVVHDVLDGFIATGPTPAELKAAKQYLVDGLALRIDSNAKLLGYLSAIGFFNLPLTYIDDYPQLIQSVTAEQVRKAFASHVRAAQLNTVVVGTDGEAKDATNTAARP